MPDDRRHSILASLSARVWASPADREAELRRRRAAEPTRAELHALADELDLAREQRVTPGVTSPLVSVLAGAAGADAETAGLALALAPEPPVVLDRVVVAAALAGADRTVLAAGQGMSAGGFARALRATLRAADLPDPSGTTVA